MRVSLLLYLQVNSLQYRLDRFQSLSGCFTRFPVHVEGVPTKVIKTQMARRTVFVVFLDVMPCNFIFRVEEDSTLKMEAVGLSGMTVPFHQLHSITSEKTQFIIRTCENLKFHFYFALHLLLG
jgi:Regulator of polyketide synthase expression